MKKRILEYIIKFTLRVNSIVLQKRVIAKYFLNFWYSTQLIKITKQFNRQGHEIPIDEVIQGILNTYYHFSFKQRPYIKLLVDAVNVVPNTTPIEKKTKQYRNEKCNCGSGLKYKKCCLIKQIA